MNNWINKLHNYYGTDGTTYDVDNDGMYIVKMKSESLNNFRYFHIEFRSTSREIMICFDITDESICHVNRLENNGEYNGCSGYMGWFEIGSLESEESYLLDNEYDDIGIVPNTSLYNTADGLEIHLCVGDAYSDTPESVLLVELGVNELMIQGFERIIKIGFNDFKPAHIKPLDADMEHSLIQLTN